MHQKQNFPKFGEILWHFYHAPSLGSIAFVLKAILHEGSSHLWAQSIARSSFVIGPIPQIGHEGIT